MIIETIDLLKSKNNFDVIKNVPSFQIIKANLNFVPKITVAIPTFRRAELLREAIQSIIIQEDFDEFDIIVVDNDPQRNCRTEQVMHSFKSNKINYYKNSENIGMAGNWNRLFELATADYIVMLHDDDLLLPNYLFTISKYLKNEFDVLITTLEIADLRNPLVQPSLKKVKQIGRIYRYSIWDFFFNNHPGPPTGSLFKKSFYLKMGGVSNDYYPTMDLYYFLRAVLKGRVFKLLYPKIVLYRILENDSLKRSTIESFIYDNYNYRVSIINHIAIFFFKPLLLRIAKYIFLNDIISLSKYHNINLDYIREESGITLKHNNFEYYLFTKCYSIYYYIKRIIYTIQDGISDSSKVA